MSKMSQLHAELTEQAAHLGFQSIEEAEANGFKVDYEKQELVPDVDQAYNDKEEEDYIDLVPILENLYFDTASLPNKA